MKRPDREKSRPHPSVAIGNSRPADHERRGRGLGLRWQRYASSLAIVAALSGCGKSEDSLPRLAVSGNVTLDGKPLEKGVISFMPDATAANPVTGGGVISAGSYSIPVDRGLTPGKYKVSITGSEEGPGLAAGEAPGAPPKPKAKAEPTIPAKFNSQSTLDADVKSGNTTQNFTLTSK